MKKFRIVLVFFAFFIGIFFLFPQRVEAIGETTVVQINGPAQPPGFSPALLTIHLYDTVIFVNHTNIPYAVTSTDGSFSSPDIPAGQQWRVTFGSVGGHEYHTTEAPQRMVGEIVVVSNAVSLFPTPMPQVEATVVTLIKAGKHPPDVIVLPVTTPPVVKHTTPVSTLHTFLSPLVLSIAGGILFVFVLILLGILLYRRHAKRVKDEAEMDTLLEEIVPKPITPKVQTPAVEAVAPIKKRRLLLAGFHWKRSHDDDDDDDEE
jgi:plastocyanin